MAKLKFYLKEPNQESATSLFFMFNYGAFEIINGKKRYRPLKYYISESIEPKHWNREEERARRTYRQYSEFNARLQAIEAAVYDTYRKLLNDDIEVNNDILKEELDALFNPEVQQTTKPMEFMDFFKYYTETADHAYNTTKTYKQTFRDLREYEQANRVKLTFERIDLDFHNSFISFLQKTRNFAPNTIGQRIKNIKTILRASHDRGLHDNRDYQKKSFNKPREQTTAIYLCENELMRLYNLDLSKDERLNNARDWFIIGAYTGLRYSDLRRLSSSNIKASTIEIKTQKTGEEVIIPISKKVRAILNKHNNNLPRIVSNQKFNKYIKEVCKLAEINEPISVEETKGKLSLHKTEPKYNLVSAHTARRSFATNAYLSGLPTINIMKMTGHRTEKSFLQYIKITKEENAKKLISHPFFSGMAINE